MKLQLLFLLLQLFAISNPSIANDTTQLVYDTDGKALLSSEFRLYYVLPAKRGSGGGFTFIPVHHGGLCYCLSFVAQESNEALLRIPVGINPMPPNAFDAFRQMPLNASNEAIRLSSDVWFIFWDLGNICSKKHDWHVTDQSPGQYQHVAAGNEDSSWSKGLFRIERHDADTTGYKLVACVNGEGCKDLGLHTYKNRTGLTVSDDPLMVVFKNAEVSGISFYLS